MILLFLFFPCLQAVVPIVFLNAISFAFHEEHFPHALSFQNMDLSLKTVFLSLDAFFVFHISNVN